MLNVWISQQLHGFVVILLLFVVICCYLLFPICFNQMKIKVVNLPLGRCRYRVLAPEPLTLACRDGIYTCTVYTVYTIWIHQGIGEQRICYDFFVLFGTHMLSSETEILSIT